MIQPLLFANWYEMAGGAITHARESCPQKYRGKQDETQKLEQ